MLPCHPVSSYLAFSPLPPKIGGGCFLSHYSTLADGFPLGNMMLCVARTFLPQHNYTASDKTCYCQNIDCVAKIVRNDEIHKRAPWSEIACRMWRYD